MVRAGELTKQGFSVSIKTRIGSLVGLIKLFCNPHTSLELEEDKKQGPRIKNKTSR